MTIPEDSTSTSFQAPGAASPFSPTTNAQPHISDAEIEKLSKVIFSNIPLPEKYEAIESIKNLHPQKDQSDLPILYKEAIQGMLKEHQLNDLMANLGGAESVGKNLQFAYQLSLQSEDYKLQFIQFAKNELVRLDRDIHALIINFGINPDSNEGQEILIILAKETIKGHYCGGSQSIQKYKIVNEKDRIEIAKFAAQRSGADISEYIQNYGIANEKDRIEIAKVAARESGAGTSRFIQNYGITNEKDRIEIAKLAMETDGLYGNNHPFGVRYFRISGGSTSTFIKNYGITDEKDRIKIAMLGIQTGNGDKVSLDIKKYEITSEKDRIEIAKFAAQQDGSEISQFIKNYEITSEKDRIEIAKLDAQQSLYTSQYIQNYGITDEKDRIEIAKLAAQQNGGQTSRFIKNHEITSEKDRIEIAKLAAQQSGDTSQFIKNYEITSEKDRIEIAKLAAQYGGLGTSQYIQNYGITSEKDRVEIAKLAVLTEVYYVGVYFDNYKITDEKDRIEIAKVSAQFNGEETSKVIQNYEITDKKDLIEIAKLAAQQDGGGTSENIQNYNINNIFDDESDDEYDDEYSDVFKKSNRYEKDLIEIAKLAAQQDGGGTSEHIGRYYIKDQHALLEVAKIASDQNPLSTATFINDYLIDPKNFSAKNILIAIAFRGVGTDLTENHKLYNQLCMKDPHNGCRFSAKENRDRFLFLSLFKSSDHINSEAIEKLSLILGNHPILSLLPLLDPSNKIGVEWSSEAFNALEGYLKTKGEDSLLLKILDDIRNIKAKDEKATLFLQKNSLLWLVLTTLYFESEAVNVRAEDVALLQHILKLQDPNLRYTLSLQFAKMAKNLNIRRAFDALNLDVNKAIPVTSKRKPIFELTKLILATNFPDLETNKLVVSKVLGGDFIDAVKGRLLIRVLDSLAEKQSLTDEQKVELLRKIFNAGATAKQVVANLKAVEGILAFNKLQKLVDAVDFPTTFLEIFKELIPVDFEASDFNEKYSNTIAKYRLPLSLAIYAAKTNLLPTNERQQMLSLLAEYVTHVFNGDFKEWRYEIERSPHLQKLAAEYPQVLEKWKQGMPLFKITIKNDREVNLPNFKTLLQGSFAQGHMADGAYSLLSDYLDSGSLPEGVERGSVEDYGIKLVQATTVEEAIAYLEAMMKAKRGSRDQFNADLEGWHHELTKSRSGGEQVRDIVDTDDSCDLLLAGTEMSGSCQNVEGDPQLNKCLMAYVTDGKNRMIAIKDPETGRVIARSIIRLLLDKGTNCPVMFLEPVYPDLADAKLKDEIIKYAKVRAVDLGVPLLTQLAAEGEPYTGEIVSLGGRAPFEYADGDEGVIPNSTYTLSGLYRL